MHAGAPMQTWVWHFWLKAELASTMSKAFLPRLTPCMQVWSAMQLKTLQAPHLLASCPEAAPAAQCSRKQVSVLFLPVSGVDAGLARLSCCPACDSCRRLDRLVVLLRHQARGADLGHCVQRDQQLPLRARRLHIRRRSTMHSVGGTWGWRCKTRAPRYSCPSTDQESRLSMRQ